MEGKHLYEHTQKSALHSLIFLPAILMFFVAWQTRGSAPSGWILVSVGILLIFLAMSFQTLTLRERQDSLEIKYGPLNIFGTHIPYSDMTNVQSGHTNLIDGWGIHYVPCRGWTMNLWGFECVKIERGSSVIRLGTDDSENLVSMLQQRLNDTGN